MKTKKLIAILTIVALMMGLVPMAAFAAEQTGAAVNNLTLSQRQAADTSVTYNFDVVLPAMEAGDTVVLNVTDSAKAVVATFTGYPINIAADGKATIGLAAGVITITAGAEGTAAGTYAVTITGAVNPVAGTYHITDNNSVPADRAVLATFKTVTTYSAAASLLTVDKTTVAAGKNATFTLSMRDGDGYAFNGDITNLWIKSSRDAESGMATGKTDSTFATDKEVTLVAAELGKVSGQNIGGTFRPAKNGQITFTITSSIAGEATVKVYNADPSVVGNNAILVGEQKVTFTSDTAAANAVALTGSWALDGTTYDVVDGGRFQAGVAFSLTATVKDNKGNGIAGQEITFQKKLNGGNAETIGTATTNAIGVATLAAPQTKSGIYEFIAKVGTADPGTLNANVHHGTPTSITAVEASAYSELNTVVSVRFIIKDAFGNIFGSKYTAPGKSEFVDDKNMFLVADDASLTGVIYAVPEGSTLKNYTTSNIVGTGLDTGKMIATFTADKAGAYTIVGSISGTGITAITTVNVGKFGTAKSLELTPTTPTMKYNSSANAVTAKLVDENGIKKPASDVVFSSSNTALITVDTAGVLTSNAAVATRGVATITATHLPTGFTASVDVAVTGDPVDIIVTPTVTDKVAKINMQLADAQGNKAFYVAPTTVPTPFTVIAPAGVSITDVSAFTNKGVGSFTATSLEAGQKSVTVVANTGLTKTFTISFATPVSDIPGAASINMYVGAKGFFADGEEVSCDVAPFIGEGDRTFVELRNLANAMGVANEDITYVDGVITLVRADMTLVLTIGSQTIQKTVDGVTTTITSDVAPYVIAEAGRTVLPLRAVGEAFGYTVNYNPANQLITITR